MLNRQVGHRLPASWDYTREISSTAIIAIGTHSGINQTIIHKHACEKQQRYGLLLVLRLKTS
jgi:hypothetical protein